LTSGEGKGEQKHYTMRAAGKGRRENEKLIKTRKAFLLLTAFPRVSNYSF
jgi:hypothetical protein